jgi:hypothetical protein
MVIEGGGFPGQLHAFVNKLPGLEAQTKYVPGDSPLKE